MSENTVVYVWAFLPRVPEPVLAGVLTPVPGGLSFTYADSYLEEPSARTLGPDLPFRARSFPPAEGHGMPSSLRDAAPDSWGRRVVNFAHGVDPEDDLPLSTYLLESGSDRAGAVDFQASPETYVPRAGGGTLEELAAAAAAIDADDRSHPIAPHLLYALSAPGGSQPKAFVAREDRQWLAKFPTKLDEVTPVIRGEAAALRLARATGVNVPDSLLVDVPGHGAVLLTERFDRRAWGRVGVVSGMTVAGHSGAAGGSYPDLIRAARNPRTYVDEPGRELFARLAFRIALRIDDDHLRNVAFFWSGEWPETRSHIPLTPAFDLAPTLTAAKPIGLTDLGGTREFALHALLDAHEHYGVGRRAAAETIERTLGVIVAERVQAATAARMTSTERELFETKTATSELVGGPIHAGGRTVAPGERLQLLVAATMIDAPSYSVAELWTAAEGYEVRGKPASERLAVARARKEFDWTLEGLDEYGEATLGGVRLTPWVPDFSPLSFVEEVAENEAAAPHTIINAWNVARIATNRRPADMIAGDRAELVAAHEAARLIDYLREVSE